MAAVLVAAPCGHGGEERPFRGEPQTTEGWGQAGTAVWAEAAPLFCAGERERSGWVCAWAPGNSPPSQSVIETRLTFRAVVNMRGGGWRVGERERGGSSSSILC